MNRTAIRTYFPSLANSNLIYFDAAAMAPMHQSTIDIIESNRIRTNVHRAVYKEGEDTDRLFNLERERFSEILGCHTTNISFCDRTTLGLNHLSFSLEDFNFKQNDSIWVSRLEHHSNWLPWQRLARKKGLKLVEIPLCKDTLLPDLEWIKKEAQSQPPALCAVTHSSNVTGGVVDLGLVRRLVGDVALLIVDGAQAVAHMPVNLKNLNVDAYVCSGYKFGAMTGTGVLYLSNRIKDNLEPSFLGGGMVDTVSLEGSKFKTYPEGWESGTPNIDGVLTLSNAYRNWFQDIEFINKELHLRKLFQQGVKDMKGIYCLGSGLEDHQTIGVVSFISKKWHSHDLGTLLGDKGFAVRVGHHCAQRLFLEINESSSVRISFGPYNTEKEVELLLESLSLIEDMA